MATSNKDNMTTLAIAQEIEKLAHNYVKKIKDQMKNGEIKIKDNLYGTFSIENCTKSHYSDDDKKRIDKWAESQLISKIITDYQKITITTTQIAKDKAKELFNLALDNTESKVTQKVASKIINKAQ